MQLLPKRRWLRFSLRTLLVAVTIFCVWLGWQVSIVRGRNQLVSAIRSQGGGCDPLEPEDLAVVTEYSIDETSLVRRLLGDETWIAIYLPDSASDEYTAEVEKAFPESFVFHPTRDKPRCMFEPDWTWPVRHTPSDLTDQQQQQ